jgi:hypothetical protein
VTGFSTFICSRERVEKRVCGSDWEPHGNTRLKVPVLQQLSKPTVHHERVLLYREYELRVKASLADRCMFYEVQLDTIGRKLN